MGSYHESGPAALILAKVYVESIARKKGSCSLEKNIISSLVQRTLGATRQLLGLTHLGHLSIGGGRPETAGEHSVCVVRCKFRGASGALSAVSLSVRVA